jgi:hypothetical protein
VVTQLFVRLVIAFEIFAAVLPKDALYSTRPVMLDEVALHSKSLMAMLDVLGIYGIKGTFGQRKVVDAIQERGFACSIRPYDKV